MRRSFFVRFCVVGAGRVGCGICGVVFGIRYARGAYAGSMVGWVSAAAGDGMRVAGCRGGMSADIFVLFGGGGA